MTVRRPPIDRAAWQPWIDHVCSALGVDPALVDPHQVHALTASVAERGDRPLAPLAAHVWGLARATHPDADPDALRSAIGAQATAT